MIFDNGIIHAICANNILQVTYINKELERQELFLRVG